MRSKVTQILLIPILILITNLATNCQKSNDMINTETVKTVDINRYMGTWYEIARFPHSFEKGLVGVTATYSMRKDGKIKVVNKGYKNTLKGKEKTAVGKAKIPDLNDPAKIKVSFFLFFYGDYFITELDENYQWALIGSNSDKYLWILSRSPKLDQDIYEMLIEKIIERGYDISKLIKVKQFD
jgi:apolipoprotein D and lipocalin family protein